MKYNSTSEKINGPTFLNKALNWKAYTILLLVSILCLQLHIDRTKLFDISADTDMSCYL